MEPYIPGHYEKFCNNFGWESSKNKLMHALMHYSYVQSKGDLLLCDLQGMLQCASKPLLNT